uniref:Retrovirus-related Pol polyprotein from transposon TNT 1-94 n=1 Tax=Cajanus cajan TaxID=3821 RepID=A0A151UB37_CAJCA|nr:Retrovirus-related Pol polyprotein from transposon TNT 1-94 [Cajanus cajan]KYP76536.1 Retrovirus-related Pol polyprotein from transposon TNT 1-94 [Cajanus cajan]
MLVAGSNMDEINRLKTQLSEEFEMKDLGATKQILGMNISRNRSEGSLILFQEKYIGKLLEKFSMQDAKIVSTPLGVFGRLLRHKESTTGFVFAVGGTTISWMSRLQKSVAFSTIEA